MAIWDRRGGARRTGDRAPRSRLPFDVQDVASGDRHTLVLSGELDVMAGDELEAVIITCANAAALTLDLSRLTFMDSTGVKLLLLAQDLCEVRGIVFALVPGPAQVQLICEVAGLLDRLPFEMEPAT